MTQLIQPLMQRIDEIGQAINGLMQQPLQNTPYGDDNQGAV
jgi:hypothetical protein